MTVREYAPIAVLVDALNGSATVFSLHETEAAADGQAEMLDGAFTRAVVGTVAEGDRVRYSATECGH